MLDEYEDDFEDIGAEEQYNELDLIEDALRASLDDYMDRYKDYERYETLSNY